MGWGSTAYPPPTSFWGLWIQVSVQYLFILVLEDSAGFVSAKLGHSRNGPSRFNNFVEIPSGALVALQLEPLIAIDKRLQPSSVRLAYSEYPCEAVLEPLSLLKWIGARSPHPALSPTID